MISYIWLFIIFSFVGWVIDSSYRILVEKEKKPGTLIPLFSPIYGIGGISLVLIFRFVQVNPVIQVLIGAVALTLIEFVGGVLCLKVLKKRLWDYSKSKYNISGHIDALHFVYWLILTILMRIVLGYLKII